MEQVWSYWIKLPLPWLQWSLSYLSLWPLSTEATLSNKAINIFCYYCQYIYFSLSPQATSQMWPQFFGIQDGLIRAGLLYCGNCKIRYTRWINTTKELALCYTMYTLAIFKLHPLTRLLFLTITLGYQQKAHQHTQRQHVDACDGGFTNKVWKYTICNMVEFIKSTIQTDFIHHIS